MLLLLSGCGDTTIATGELAPEMSVTAYHQMESTWVQVKLWHGRDVIELPEGDSLVTSSESGDTVALSAHHMPFTRGAYWLYRATLPSTDQRDFTVALLRADGEDASASNASVPAPAAIDPASLSISIEASELALRWSNPAEDTQMRARLDTCGGGGNLGAYEVEGSDAGVYTVPMGDVQDFLRAIFEPGDCVGVVLTRSRSGTPDPTLNPASTFVAERAEYFQIALTP
jgi:hypothetical protein